MTPLVEASQLTIDYRVGDKRVRALDSLDLAVPSKQTLAVVGESGSGKSTLGLAIGRLLPPNADHREGDLLLDGRSVFAFAPKEIRALRRDRLGFVFQSATAALDPTRRVSRQLRDALERERRGHPEPERRSPAHGWLQRARRHHKAFPTRTIRRNGAAGRSRDGDCPPARACRC